MKPRAEMGAKILADLRAEGYKVKVSHHRKRQHAGALKELQRIAKRVDPNGESSHVLAELESCLPLEPNGGTTTVTIYNPNDVVLTVGYSDCRDDERFNRQLGLTIAAGRARKKLHVLVPF